MCHKFSKRSSDRMRGVHPDLITIFNEAIKYSYIDFGVPETGGVRSAGEQNILFQTGVTKCDGFNDLSHHQSGKALDFFAYVNGKASWDKVHLSLVAGVIMSTAERLLRSGKIKSKIKWGGDFGSDSHHGFDYPHFQIV